MKRSKKLFVILLIFLSISSCRNDKKALTEKNDILSNSNYQAAITAYNNDDFHAAVTAFYKIDKSLLSGDDLFSFGFCLFEDGKANESIDLYEQAILSGTCTKIDKAYNNIGLVKAHLEDYILAIDFFTHAINLNPVNSYYYNRALSYLGVFENEKSCIDINKAIELGYDDNKGEKLKSIVCY
jgi:tetratricopeptide (TPR) repeat protein